MERAGLFNDRHAGLDPASIGPISLWTPAQGRGDGWKGPDCLTTVMRGCLTTVVPDCSTTVMPDLIRHPLGRSHYGPRLKAGVTLGKGRGWHALYFEFGDGGGVV